MISIITPTYDEEGNIGGLVKEIHEAMKDYEHEVIVVDDNSKDNTRKIAEENGARVIHRVNERGIWTAIQKGIQEAKGDIIVTMDADFSHPPKIIPLMIKRLDEYDMASGSRFIEGGDIIAPLHRTKYASMYLNKLQRIIMGVKQYDLSGGFHAMWRNKFLAMKFKYPSVWGEFDLEWFYRAKKLGYKIKEIPFVQPYRKAGHSKSKTLIYVWYYLMKAIKLRLFG
jgi:dolichol-phosphate mannosyltransferase